MLDRVPKILKNFYVIVGAFFLFWMLFIDSADVFSHAKLKLKKAELEAEKSYYQNMIREVEADREALLNNDQLLEKFAREKYFMKKPNEDVFVVVEKED